MSAVGLVSIDLRDGEFIVQSSSKTKAGFWITNGFLERLPESVTDEGLGDCILRAAAASAIGVENPEPRQPLPSLTKLLDEVGVKSYGRYMVGTKAVRAQILDDGIVRVTPYRNGGSKEGFRPIDDAAEDLTSPPAETVAKAVRAAFQRAE